jgi:hypothetical protein
MPKVTINCSKCNEKLVIDVPNVYYEKYMKDVSSHTPGLLRYLIFSEYRPDIMHRFKKSLKITKKFLWTNYYGIGDLCPNCHKNEAIKLSLQKIENLHKKILDIEHDIRKARGFNNE